jgi:hypothetical protein
MVTYVCPRKKKTTDGKKHFHVIVDGFFHLSFLNNGTGELPSKEMVDLHKKNHQACTSEVEAFHPCNVYRNFDIVLPTMQDFEKNRSSNKEGRQKRGGKKKQDEDEDEDKGGEVQEEEDEEEEEEEEDGSFSSESD